MDVRTSHVASAHPRPPPFLTRIHRHDIMTSDGYASFSPRARARGKKERQKRDRQRDSSFPFLSLFLSPSLPSSLVHQHERPWKTQEGLPSLFSYLSIFLTEANCILSAHHGDLKGGSLQSRKDAMSFLPFFSSSPNLNHDFPSQDATSSSEAERSHRRSWNLWDLYSAGVP